MKDWTDVELYHYTNFGALEGILRGKQIWLGNLRHLNDRMELQFFFECLKETLIRETPEYTEKIEDLFKEQVARFSNLTAYAFSMSRARDDASQWDRYSNKGKGVCLRLNAEKLNEKIKDNYSLQEVFYKKDLPNHKIKGLIQLYIMSGIVDWGFRNIGEIFENAWACSIAFKHPSFAAENEVRICPRPFIDNWYNKGYKYIANREGLSEYIPIMLCDEEQSDYGGIIEEIILGPNAGIDINVMERYLKYLQIDKGVIKISESTCPLR